MDTTLKTDVNSAMRSNMWKLYAVQSLTQALFFIPIVFLVWQKHGLSMQQVMLLQAGFAFTILVFEIPTGYIADRWGRKNSIVAGCMFAALSFCIYPIAENFWLFLAAEVIMGIGASLLSGAVEALTYDTLLTLKKEKTFRQVSGNMSFLEFSTEALSGLIGGLVAVISLTVPMYMTIIPMFGAFLIALTLKEPLKQGKHETQHVKAIWNVTTHTLVTHRALRSVIVMHAVISVLPVTFFWFFQPYQKLVGVPIVLFGLMHAIGVVAGAFASKYVATLEERIDDRVILMSIGGVLIFCFLLLGLPPSVWLLGAFWLSRFAWGALHPLTSDMINRMTESDVRATVLSLRSFIAKGMFVCCGPIIGLLGDTYSINFALLMTGLVGMGVFIILFIRMKPVWSQIPS